MHHLKRSKLRVAATIACGLYALLLLASHIVWSANPREERELTEFENRIELSVVEGSSIGDESVSLVYRDRGPASGAADAPAILMLHGSPGTSRDFFELEDGLAENARVIIPDLPGFGGSQLEVPDYSVEAHAIYVQQLLSALGVERCHVIGFSMGSGVALQLANHAPDRVASVTMLAGTGVQEHELFGDYELNHHVHRVTLAASQAYRYAFPHFGSYDEFPLNHTFGRNFFDTDQRKLRDVLERIETPLQIIHGEEDFLVPVGAALEHHRIVPHSELHLLEGSHFLPWKQHEEVERLLLDFVERVESGNAIVRANASSERVAAAAVPFDPKSIPPISGFALLIAMVLIAAATLLTEDLTCIAVGLVIAQGRIGYVPGAFACFCGIFFGDVLLYLMGRFIGRAAMGRRPLRWWLTPARIDRASVWFQTKGMQVIFVSRFLPGFRVPTYFAAGVLKTHFVRFAIYFAVAVALWTPVLVGISMWAGHEVAGSIESLGAWAVPGLIALALAIYFVQSLALPMFSHRGRRLLLGRFRRKLRWEFWPPVVFYAPVALYAFWLALRYRSLTVFTAANPGIPTGGFIGESKSSILASLGNTGSLPKSVSIPAGMDETEALAAAKSFLEQLERPYPIVLKPDSGQRGSGVNVLADEAALSEALATTDIDRMLQEYVDGLEFGIFWIHAPNEKEGRIFSITEKEFPTVCGDGERTLEELILDDPRAVCQAATYLNANAAHIMDIPQAGESVQLVDLGTHCLGAIFRDGKRFATPELHAAVSKLASGFEGFHFGRFDVRVPSEEDFAAGRNLSVLELNGVTSEATHIYDPKIGLREAYGVLFEQWRLAFEIGSLNVANGSPATTCRELFATYREYRRQQSSHAKPKKSAAVAAT